jgi:hypothetical protein
MRLYRLLTHVEGQLAFEDVKAFVFLVMDVQHAPVAIRGEYLYQSAAPIGLLSCGLDGGKHPDPPPRLAFTRLVREGSARGVFRVEHNLHLGLVLCSRHGVFSFPCTIVCREQ